MAVFIHSAGSCRVSDTRGSRRRNTRPEVHAGRSHTHVVAHHSRSAERTVCEHRGDTVFEELADAARIVAVDLPPLAGGGPGERRAGTNRQAAPSWPQRIKPSRPGSFGNGGKGPAVRQGIAIRANLEVAFRTWRRCRCMIDGPAKTPECRESTTRAALRRRRRSRCLRSSKAPARRVRFFEGHRVNWPPLRIENRPRPKSARVFEGQFPDARDLEVCRAGRFGRVIDVDAHDVRFGPRIGKSRALQPADVIMATCVVRSPSFKRPSGQCVGPPTFFVNQIGLVDPGGSNSRDVIAEVWESFSLKNR